MELNKKFFRYKIMFFSYYLVACAGIYVSYKETFFFVLGILLYNNLKTIRMKKKEIELIYETPVVEIIGVQVENGLASSTEDTDLEH